MKKCVSFLALVVLLTITTSGIALAGTGGQEFTEVYTMIKDWTQGFLGRALAVGMFLVGIAIGVVRQSLMSIALGVGSGLALYYTPNIIESVITALI